MKEIKIKIYEDNNLYTNKLIVNNNSQIINISNDGYYHLKGIENEKIKVFIHTYKNTYIINLLITNKYNNPYIIVLNSFNPKTIYLYDKNFNNLKIEKGKIIIWQNNII